jgi:hypothetical protein
MKRLLPFLFLLLGPVEAQVVQPIDSKLTMPAPDCAAIFRTTSAKRAVVIDNRTAACTEWVVSYSSSGLTGLTVSLESAADSNGSPSAWGTFPGASPSTLVGIGLIAGHNYQPWVSINISGLSGTGFVSGTLSGFKARPTGFYFSFVTATISNGNSLSGAVALSYATPVRITMPAGWDAARLTFQVSYDGITFNDLYDEYGQEVTIEASAGRGIRLDPKILFGAMFLKVRSGIGASPVNQTASRTIVLVTRVLQ